MLREAFRLARDEQRVVIFLEPIALYNLVDLNTDGDAAWSHPLREPEDIRPGRVAISLDHGSDLLILTYGNGHYLSHQAAAILGKEHGVGIQIIDIRWLHPLPGDEIISKARKASRILIVDECRQTGSVSEEIITLITDGRNHRPGLAGLRG